MLKKNGLLIFSVPNMDSFIGDTINNTLNLPPHHLSHWSEETIRYMNKIFPLSLVDIYYEPVYLDFHKKWYKETKLKKSLIKLTGKKQTLIDRSIINKLTHWLVRIYILFSGTKNISDKGHTISVVFKKNQ